MTPFHQYPNAHRMLARMPLEHQSLFTEVQVAAIENAIAPRTHKLDLRLSLPLLGKGAYFVFMGGPNRRQSDRTRAEQLKQQPIADVQSALTKAASISGTLQHSPTVRRLLQRVPNKIIATFEPAQIRAMEKALVPRSHLVDIRLSLPLFGKGAYLVFSAGPNRRSHYRDLQNGNPFVMPAVFASVIVGAGSIFGLVHLKGSSILAAPDPVFDQGPDFHQTVVPFKKNQRECMESGRQWINNECIDDIHDPTF